ncbi:MAG: hypothetical protein HGA45_20640 [Chloroflexales bacterium]|nr:hypothetical protein [Chloroflexales bacterium]
MFETHNHHMELERTHPSGAEEWFCPTCGRRFLMQWPPNYKKIVLEPGDEMATHSGGKGGLQMGAAEVMPADEGLQLDQPVLGDADMPDSHPTEPPPWLKWLDEYDSQE